MKSKNFKIGNSTIEYDFEEESIEMEYINSNHETKSIILNNQYKNWKELKELCLKAERGNIQAMQELETEMINIIKCV
ncbi:hypothetical protein [Terrisporobacter petrolearius]|uniref:hypothetical protein n=1 Tax=Terrisporobacter petrolearius TaxID=1460447 RepID=UPI0031CCC84D